MTISQLLFVFVISTIVVAKAQYKCNSDEDCSLNGICQSNYCACDVGWTGDDCGILDLLPANRNTGYNRTGEGISSWGGKIILDPNNSSLYHLFAAEFTHGCGLTYWSPYSRIIHALSTTIEGPYTFSSEVVGTFAHNPTVIYSSFHQLWLMVHIGCNQTVPNTCQGIQISCDNGNNNNGESGITLRVSKTLDGEWENMGMIIKADAQGQWDTDTTNPSIYPLNNGSVVLAYRGCTFNCGGSEMINIAVSNSLTGPYERLQPNPIFQNPNEDPFIWQDTRGNWHLLMHSLESDGGFGGPRVGRHAFMSGCGDTWQFCNGNWTFGARNLAYNTTVTFTDRSTIDFNRRERPQLYLSPSGQMLYLINGVQEHGTDASYTFIQPIRS